MKYFLILFACVAFPLFAAENGIVLRNNGSFSIDGISAGVMCYGADWEPYDQRRSGAEGPGEFFRFSLNRLSVTEKAVKKGDTVVLACRAEAPEPVTVRQLVFQLEIPVEAVSGKPFLLNNKELSFPSGPATFLKGQYDGIRRIGIPLASGFLAVELPEPSTVILEDLRRHQQDRFCIRIGFSVWHGKIESSEFSARFTLSAYRFRALDLRPAVNMGFADETAGDGKGGWTDQGPGNDLKELSVTEVALDGAVFPILDPEKNGGRSCIVLGTGGGRKFPEAATIELNGAAPKKLLLLHALAWLKNGETSGTISVLAIDGTRQEIPVVAGQDAGNWYAGSRTENGAIAWSGFSGEARAVLYASEFALPGKPLRSVTFRSGGNAMWMVVSALTTDVPFRFTCAPERYVLAESGEWRALKPERDVRPGSALDFSFLLDAPAGKYGRLRVRDGHFHFERSERPVRFYGANLCYSACYLSKEECEALAGCLARIGYNAVRLHHFDRDLVRDLPHDSHTVNPEQLDRLDYLVYALKKHGIYVTLDLFTDRRARPGEFKTFPGGLKNYKPAIMFVPEVNAKFREFVKTLLAHVNPYTGMSYAADPALIFISILNENTVLRAMDGYQPELKALLEAQFEADCRENGIRVASQNHAAEYQAFLLKLYAEYYRSMCAFLRDLGVEAPLTEQNFVSSPQLFEQRSRYDYVDNHIYFSHPAWIGKPWQLPMAFSNGSSLTSGLFNIREIAPTRIFGKPFTVTEFDYCYPNRWRGEGSILFGTFAAWQDWDAVFRFAYSHERNRLFKDYSMNIFDVATDPPRLFGERLGVALFLRGDVAPAKDVFPIAVDSDRKAPFRHKFPLEQQMLTFRGRTGSVSGNGGREALQKVSPQTTAFADPAGSWRADFRDGSFQVSTSGSFAAVLPESGIAESDRFRIKAGENGFIGGAVALDGESFNATSRILLLLLPDVKRVGDTFSSARMEVLLKYGKGAQIARRMEAELTLRLPPSGWKLYALDLAGEQIQEMKLTDAGGQQNLILDNFSVPGKVVFAYELIREPADTW